MNIGIGITIIIGAQRHFYGYLTPFSESDNPKDVILNEPGQYTLAAKQLIALGCIKLSFLYFYRRIFCQVKPSIFDRITQVMIGLTVAWTVGFCIASLLRCGKHFTAAFGSKKDVSTKCHSIFAIEDSLAISDFLFDLIIILMPIPKVGSTRLAGQPRADETLTSRDCFRAQVGHLRPTYKQLVKVAPRVHDA
ncbi:MAG: hypothetical protein Q9219_000729 [cf. Caloplaca sp. 3 TL-2023]